MRQTPGFNNLAEYALTCLLVPSSNAVVERVFFSINCNENKTQEPLGCREPGLYHDICCTKLIVTDRMRSLHTVNKDRKRHTSEATSQSQLTLGGACANHDSAVAASDNDEDQDGVLAFLED